MAAWWSTFTHWLNDRQFLDAVAVAMITPGPVVITVAFIGYLVAGLGGALAASIGVFLPCYLFVVLLAPHYRRYADNRSVKAFVTGVTAAACGAISGAAFVLGRRAIIDLVFTSNRGDDTVGIFAPEAESDLLKVGVGIRPNGLAFELRRIEQRAELEVLHSRAPSCAASCPCDVAFFASNLWAWKPVQPPDRNPKSPPCPNSPAYLH